MYTQFQLNQCCLMGMIVHFKKPQARNMINLCLVAPWPPTKKHNGAIHTTIDSKGGWDYKTMWAVNLSKKDITMQKCAARHTKTWSHMAKHKMHLFHYKILFWCTVLYTPSPLDSEVVTMRAYTHLCTTSQTTSSHQ